MSAIATQPANAIENGASQPNLSANKDQKIKRLLIVPEGATDLSIRISGGNGDADLYVQHDRRPTSQRFNCRPFLSGNNESCSISTPLAGTYYIAIRAYSDFSGVTLTTNFTESGVPPNPEPPTTPTDGCMDQTEQDLLDAHNAARAQGRSCGGTFFAAAAPLQWSCALGQAASDHSSDMADNNFFSHTGSNGSSAGQRIATTGYAVGTWGENIAAGYGSVDSVMQGWLTSPGHCSNIMRSTVTEIGAALEVSPGADFSNYWTTVFARPQ